MANGRVITGYSYPMVATYTYNSADDSITLSNAMFLARGVSWSIAVNQSNDGGFYADNMKAESDEGKFKTGTLTQVVDGLKPAAENFVMGLPEAAADGSREYNDDQTKPYVASGCVVEWLEGGVTTYEATVLYKTKYNEIGETRETRGEERTYQTQQLTAAIERSDAAKHPWKWISAAVATESAALDLLKAKMGYSE